MEIVYLRCGRRRDNGKSLVLAVEVRDRIGLLRSYRLLRRHELTAQQARNAALDILLPATTFHIAKAVPA